MQRVSNFILALERFDLKMIRVQIYCSVVSRRAHHIPSVQRFELWGICILWAVHVLAHDSRPAVYLEFTVSWERLFVAPAKGFLKGLSENKFWISRAAIGRGLSGPYLHCTSKNCSSSFFQKSSLIKVNASWHNSLWSHDLGRPRGLARSSRFHHQLRHPTPQMFSRLTSHASEIPTSCAVFSLKPPISLLWKSLRARITSHSTKTANS